MSVFVVACIAVTIYAMDNEPQYVKVTHYERPAVTVDESIVRININTASLEELQTLHGIGEVLAGRIIAYREEIGDFHRVAEIMEVQGIGEVMFERIKDYICVD